MQKVLSRNQARELDRRASAEFGVHGVVLMENAGRAAAEILCSLAVHGRVLVCCGKGNNGGDGFVIARHLANRGMKVETLLFAQPQQLTGDALTNFHILERGQVPFRIGSLDILNQELPRTEWVVDALFGTGLQGPVQPPQDLVIEAINAWGGRVLAVDIPSGLDADSGQASGAAVRASHTVTFVASKLGFTNPAAAAWLGRVHVADIGLPRILWGD